MLLDSELGEGLLVKKKVDMGNWDKSKVAQQSKAMGSTKSHKIGYIDPKKERDAKRRAAEKNKVKELKNKEKYKKKNIATVASGKYTLKMNFDAMRNQRNRLIELAIK